MQTWYYSRLWWAHTGICYLKENYHELLKTIISESFIDSYLSLHLFLVRFLLISLIDQADTRNNVRTVNLICASFIRSSAHLLISDRTGTPRELFNEFKCFGHLAQTVNSIHTDGHESNQPRLETILQHECRSLSLLQVKADVPQSTHVEESLVLNFTDSRVVKVLHIHETTLFSPLIVSWASSVGFGPRLVRFATHRRCTRMSCLQGASVVGPETRAGLATAIHLLRRVVDSILSCALIECTLHQEIEEVTCGGVVSHLAIQVDCPEKRVRCGRCRIRETYQVNCHVANNSLFIKYLANGVTKSPHIHIGQGLLREETAGIYVLGCCKLVVGTN